MKRHHASALLSVALLGLGLSAACGLSNKTMTVPATVMNMAKVSGMADLNNSCTPPSPTAPMPDAWWAGLGVAEQGMAAVGFQIWRNTANGGACQEHKEIAYRGLFQYDLASVAPLKTVTKATIIFVTKIIPPDVTPQASNLCSVNSGGLGSLWEVTPSIPFAGGMTVLALSPPDPTGVVTSAAFPSGTKLVAFTSPWLAGSIGANASTLASGLGGASFEVDVTGRVQAALTANQPVIQFMLSATDEAFPRPIAPPASIDCRTLVEVQSMTVTYVGS